MADHGNKATLSADERLRLHGFKLYSRPKLGPTLWYREHQFAPMTQEQALKICDREGVSADASGVKAGR